jgi:hypothetical protein
VFRVKIFISSIIFLILLIITSMVKNKTRVIEKQLYALEKKIILEEKNINESQLEFHFLTSPSIIEKKIKILGQNEYSPIKSSKIFLSLSNFTDMKKKISVFKNLDEKKTKKN